MFGVVCTDPITGCNEPWTIAGPTDGSTNIVHHEDNDDYQLATAIDDQYGASYLGISACCKPLYNPTTGNLTVDCATTTATGVDVNADDNIDVAHPIIAQNYDCDDAEYKNKLIKATCFNYNPQCYVCNDPVTGCPVRKPVVHIGSLCADELLGYNDGLPRRTDVVEDYDRPIPFIGENASNGETLDTSCASCDPFWHNSCTATTGMCHLEVANICRAGNIYQGNISFDPGMFNFCVFDTTNTFHTKYAGFIPTSNSFDVCEVNPSTCCVKYGLTLQECNSAIQTNDITISPTTSLALGLTLTALPYTCDTENVCYTPLAINSSYNNVKKMEGFSYDPSTCYLCGNFCGNINIWPYISRWSGSSDLDGCVYVDVDIYGLTVQNYYRCSTTTTVKSDFEVTRYGILACTPANCIYLDDGYAGILDICSCCLVRVNSCSEICLSANTNAIINSDYIALSSKTAVCLFSGTAGTRGNVTLQAESFVSNCAPIIRFVNHCSGSYIEEHRIVGNGKLTKVCHGNGCEYPYALMCDLAAAAGVPSAIEYDNGVCRSLACINSLVPTSSSVGVPIRINTVTDFTVTDYLGNTIHVGRLFGLVSRESTANLQFIGLVKTSTNAVYHVDMFIANNSVVCDWTIITPVPGTLYGTASANQINVLGAI